MAFTSAYGDPLPRVEVRGEETHLHETLREHLAGCYIAARDEIRRRFGVAVDLERPPLFIVSSDRDRFRFPGHDTFEWSVAGYTTFIGTTHMLVPAWSPDVARLLGLPVVVAHVAAHESCHQAIARSRLNRVLPLWYQEGLCEYVADEIAKKGRRPRMVSIRHIPRLRILSERGKLPKVRDLFGATPKTWKHDAGYYEFAWVVLRVVEDRCAEGVRRFERELGRQFLRGERPPEEDVSRRFERSIGSFEELHRGIREYLARHEHGWVVEGGDVVRTPQGWTLAQVPGAPVPVALLSLKPRRIPFEMKVRVTISEHAETAGILFGFDNYASRYTLVVGRRGAIAWRGMIGRALAQSALDSSCIKGDGVVELTLSVSAHGVDVVMPSGDVRFRTPGAKSPCRLAFINETGPVTYQILEEVSR